ncbi:MAG: hypothetical protein B7O98_00840 [Zestosphaera tikiterensis]|uniref:MobA-like NTP transferase domain-containing protein n=1 Tax=Zestosphaera tikiterensis TaxID=1973259 RepID=A0A2R7Y8W8_9CREN|nr:MAG: hypothetical protein B7O98_00840 [Zestosphaera tikiterensis]
MTTSEVVLKMFKIPVCLIMAGGRGSRYGSPSKVVVNVCGKPLIEHVIDVVKPLCGCVVIAISKHTSGFAVITKLCSRLYVECVETLGEDYVEDLSLLIYSLPKPTLVVSGDVFTYTSVIEDFTVKALKTDGDVVTMTILKNGVEELIGISLFKGCGGSWSNIAYDSSKAIDVDTPSDLEIVERLCRQGMLTA